MSTTTPLAAVALTLVAGVMLPMGPGIAAGTASPAAGPAAPVQMPSDPATDVGAPALSFSGRYVAHVAVRRDQPQPRMQVRRTDFSSGASVLLNPSTAGGVAAGRYSMPPVVSGDGSRVAFTSSASRLVAGDTNARDDAFVRDASTETTLVSSLAFDGGFANGPSGVTSLSKNGRFAVFTSRATDVVPGSTTTNSDVYRRDLDAGTTVQVTVRPNGAPSVGPGATTADVSADGNLVAFNSFNSDLAPTDDADAESDVFLRNLTTGRTRWLSEGVPMGANPSGVVISPDGRWVASRWDDGSLHLTLVRTATTSTVAASGYATLGSFSSRLGRFVFVADGVPYVRDLATGVDTAVDVPAGGSVTNVTISGNGAYAAYDWAPDDGSPGLVFRTAL